MTDEEGGYYGEAAAHYAEPGNRRVVGPGQRRVGQKLAKLQELVRELSEAEFEHLEEEGPLKTRLHLAIRAICEHVGVPNRWDTSE